MKLAYKLIAAVTIVVLLVLAGYSWLRVERESGLFESDMRRDHRTTGRAVAALAANVAEQLGDQGTIDLVRRAGRPERGMHFDLVWLDDPVRPPNIPPELTAPAIQGDEVVGALVDGEIQSLVPFHTDRGRKGAVRIRESRSEEQRYIRATMLRVSITGLTMTLACAFVVGLIAIRFIARPLQQLVTQARRVGAGDFSVRLSLAQNDEMAELARAMNGMCDELGEAQKRVAKETANRIAALEQLRHAARLTTVGKLASGVAHELGTPLNVVHGRAKLILADTGDAQQVAHSTRIILEQAERMTRIIRQMLDLSRRRGPRKEPVMLGELAARTITLLEPLAKQSDVTFEVDDRCDEPIEADSAAIQQVLTNLIVNGIHAMPEGGRLSIRIARERRAPPPEVGGAETDYLCARVEDTGKGMPREVLEHVFEPFFTTKGVGEGTGLGLSVSSGIVQDHGGFIQVESEVGEGSRFAVYLPAPAAS